MWYKIEVGSDGGILSCIEVEGSVASGKYIRYVEADSRAEAVNLVKVWWRRAAAHKMRSRIRQHVAKQAGVCIRCEGAKSRPGRTTCTPCGVKDSERNQSRYRGRPRLINKKASTDAERAAAITRSRAKVEENRRKQNALFGAHTPRKVTRLALERALAQFDATTPRAFRVWLVAEIERLTPKKSILRQAIEQHLELAAE